MYNIILCYMNYYIYNGNQYDMTYLYICIYTADCVFIICTQYDTNDAKLFLFYFFCFCFLVIDMVILVDV